MAKYKLIKLFNNIKTALEATCNGSDETREGIERLLAYTIEKVPNILVVEDEHKNSILSMVVEYKLWGALYDISTNPNFIYVINKQLPSSKKQNEIIK